MVYPINKIVNFVIKYSWHKDRKLIKDAIEKHILFKTCIILYKDKTEKEIVAVVRFNISASGKVAHILDIIIVPEYRHKRVMKILLLKGLRMYPSVTHLLFERENKYPNREQRYIAVSRMLKRS